MAVKIKLTRLGKIRNPQYRIAVADARNRRDGRSIEVIGRYHPKEDPSLIEINSERAQYWLSVGAQPTDPVLALLKITGDWQTFKGLPGTEGTLRLAEPKPDKTALYEAATKSAMSEPKAGATTKKKKQAEPKAEKADKAEEPNARKQCGVKLPVEEKLAVQKDTQTFSLFLAARRGRINRVRV